MLIIQDTPHATISPRQQELLHLLGSGFTLKAAAQKMQVSVKTANAHKCKLMYRLQLTSRDDLVRFVERSAP